MSNGTNDTVHHHSKDKQSPSILSGRQLSKVACANMTNEEEKGEPKKCDLPQDNDVSRVIAKTKRAAASLWMILHAQTCILGGRCKCPHQGCTETKELLLHIKTCPAGPNFECPQHVNGCLQARKLLAHYRRCREIRSRQYGRGPRQHHPCLLCTLVARHMKNVLEGGPAPVASNDAVKKASTIRKGSFRSNTQTFYIQTNTKMEKKGMKTSSSLTMMPPPPPRPPTGTQNKSFSHSTYGSPPTNDQLMHSGIEAVAKAAGPAPLVGRMEEDVLGKSFETARGSFLRKEDCCNDHWNMSESSNSWNHRRRGVSFDESSTSTHLKESNERSFGSCDGRNDPTVELMLKSYGSSNMKDEGSSETNPKMSSQKKTIFGRARSSSCSVLMNISTVSQGGCDTILEE